MKFHDLKLADLKKIAKDLNVRGHSTKKKDELASMLAKTHKITKEGVVPKKSVPKPEVKQENDANGGALGGDIAALRSELENLRGRVLKVRESILGGQLPRDITDQVSSLNVK